MPNLSSRALGFRPSAIRKLDLLVAKRKGVHFHRLNIGQPDVATPEVMLEAIREFQPKVIAYGPASGLPACREAAAKYHSAWCPSLSPDDLVVTNGGSEALLFAFAAVTDDGDEILCPEPYYTNYNGFARTVGARIAPISTRLEDSFALPSNEELDALVTDKTRAFLFSNPANPTGKVYSRSEVERIAEWTASRGLWMISDEVYRRIWFEEPPASVLELEGDHLIVIDSLSKSYSACGARLGFLICRNSDLMDRVERFGQARLGPQPLAQHMAIAAHGLPESYYEEIRLIYKARMNALYEELDKTEDIVAHRPEGAFYLMCELPLASGDSEDFGRFMALDFDYEGESVVVAPGPGFYSSASENKGQAGREKANLKGSSQIRLAAVVQESKMLRAAEVLRKGVEAYRNR